MSIQDDLLIYEYLDKVSEQLVGKLGPMERSELVEQLRLDIEEQRRKLMGAERQKLTGRKKEADVSRILHQIGPPDVVAGRMLREAQADQGGPAPAPDRTAVDESATGTLSIEAPRVSSVTPVPDTADEQTTGWLPARARTAAERVWSSAGAGAAARGPGLLRAYLEVLALSALTFGSFLIGYVGLLVGFVLTLFSKKWDERDKAVAIVLAPMLTLAIGIFVVWINEGRDRSGSTSERFERVWTALGDIFSKLPLVAGSLAAIYLLYRLLTAPRQ